MTKDELDTILAENKKFKEIWVNGSDGQSMCALINSDIGWLKYLRHEGDAGFSSRNPNEISEKEIEYYLSNGQCDYYPKNWAYPLDVIREALYSFISTGQLPKQVDWHDDSK